MEIISEIRYNEHLIFDNTKNRKAHHQKIINFLYQAKTLREKITIITEICRFFSISGFLNDTEKLDFRNTCIFLYSRDDVKKIIHDFDFKKYMISIFGEIEANEISGDGLDEPYFDND